MADDTEAATTNDNEQAQGRSNKKNMFENIRVKHITAILSLVSFIFSLPILGSVTWLLYMKSYDCEWLLKLPRLQIGISIGLIFVFLICNGALFLRTRLPMVGIIVVMVPLTFMFTVGLALIGANRLESRRIPATPLWFRMKIDDNDIWNNVKGCIYDIHVCGDLATASMPLTSYNFKEKKLSSVESGCCTPPNECHIQYVNSTWVKDDKWVNSIDSSENPDCDLWKNYQDVLCYNCRSCKDGYVDALQSKWSKLGVFLVTMAVFLITCHLSLFLATMWELHCTS